MGNLVSLICELTQNYLAKKLAYSENLHATVMEVRVFIVTVCVDVILLCVLLLLSTYVLNY